MSNVFKIGNGMEEDNSYFKHSYYMPSHTQKTNSNKKIRLDNLIISIASFIFLGIMILTKLWPCFKTTWSQDFCNKWNDFWFSISASFISAILFYIVFQAIPKKQKRNEMEYHINSELISIITHLNTMIILLTNKIVNYDLCPKESFVNEIVNLDWEKKYSYLLDSFSQKNIIECIKFEINNAHNRLETIQINYKEYFTNPELTIFNKNILHSDIIQRIGFYSDTEPLEHYAKESVASMLYDFIIEMLNFSMRFRQSTYTW